MKLNQGKTFLLTALLLLVTAGCGQAESASSTGVLAEAGAAGVNRLSGNTISDNAADGEGLSENAVKPEPVQPVKARGIYISGPIAGHSSMTEILEKAAASEINAMVIDVKNDMGEITYQMDSDIVAETGAAADHIKNIDGLVQACKEKGIYLIARVVAFKDPVLAEKKPEYALYTKEGEIFRDKDGLAWVNPYEKGVWDYLVEVGRQAAGSGFDEIQFDYIRFSTDSGMHNVDFGEAAEEKTKTEAILEFTEYARDALHEEGVLVSADVYGTIISSEKDAEIVGQDYVGMAAHLDYICPMIYPSHYAKGVYGLPCPDAAPYDTIYQALLESKEKLAEIPEGEHRAIVRPWLQDFTATWVPGHISYGPKQLKEQVLGVYDAGYEEWIFWNAKNRYTWDGFMPAGETLSANEVR